MNKSIKFLLLDVDGTLTDGGVYVNEDGSEFRKFNAKDGMGVKQARKAGIEVGIISHSHLPQLIQHRADILGIPFVYVGQAPKLQILDQWLAENNWSRQEVAFIGDDINDVELAKAVGLSACPNDAAYAMKEVCTHILQTNGGAGAAREFIDNFLLKERG